MDRALSISLQDDSALMGQLADEFLAAWDRGENPSVEGLAARHPELAGAIREVLPALLALRESTGANDIKDLSSTPTLGDFQLLREIGRGGMGVVYEAEQVSLKRRVAVKILPFAASLDERRARRFQNEARAAAMLRHSHIVQVFCVGEQRGVQFFAMELIHGRALNEILAETSPCMSHTNPKRKRGETRTASLALRVSVKWQNARETTRIPFGAIDGWWRQVARWGVQAAEALHYAHQQGVVHRDIKPSNLLVDAEGRLSVTDFGLAHVPSEQTLTITGDVLGTLRYMSPEQLEGSAVVDHRTDVYSLGLTLYEALTGQPAFGATSRESLARQILETDPLAPRRVEPQIPRDLETIILKAIGEEANARYQSAGELAEDLGRFLDHRPIRASRTSSWTPLRQWCRRKPAMAALAATVAGLVLMLSIGGPLVALRQASLSGQMHRHWYVADMNLAYQSWYSGNVNRAEQLLSRHAAHVSPDSGHDFAWRYLSKLHQESERTIVRRHGGPVNDIAVFPDGRTFASAGQGRDIVLTDLQTLTQKSVLRAESSDIVALDVSRDGNLLLAAYRDGNVLVWDVGTGLPRLPPLRHGCETWAARFAPNGEWFVVGTNDGRLAAWSTSGTKLWETKAHEQKIWDVAFSPDGQRLVSGGEDFAIRIWDAATGTLERQVAVLKSNVFCTAFSPDGRILVTGAGEGLHVWDANTGAPLRGLEYDLKPVASVAISKDNLLVVGGFDNLVTVWDLDVGAYLSGFVAHGDEVWSVQFGADEQSLFSGSTDGTVRRFNLDGTRAQRQRITQRGFLWSTGVAISADGRTVISVAGRHSGDAIIPQSAELTGWDVATGKPTWTTAVSARDAGCVAITPDRRHFVTGGQGGFKIWDLNTHEVIHVLDEPDTDHFFSLVFSSDGEWLAAGGWRDVEDEQRQGLLGLWGCRNMPPYKIQESANPAMPIVTSLSFSSDVAYLAVAGGKLWQSGSVDVWVRHGDGWRPEHQRAARNRQYPKGVSFLPETHAFVSVGDDGKIELGDSTKRHIEWETTGMAQAIYCLAISPDGRVLATGADRLIKFWDLETGDQLATLDVLHWVNSMVFTPDGSTLIWGGGDGDINFIRAGRELGR